MTFEQFKNRECLEQSPLWDVGEFFLLPEASVPVSKL